MADDLSPLVNLDLINKIYKTINAQINERVYDPLWNSEAALGSKEHKYTSAFVSGNISTGTLNDLTLAASSTGVTIANPNKSTITFAPPTGTTTATAGTITITGASGTTPTVFATKSYVDDYLGDVESLLAAI